MDSDTFADLSPAELLASAEDGVCDERSVGVRRMLRVLHWADLHAGDPQAEVGAVPVKYGGDHLVAIGGEGSPKVADGCFGELAIALQSSVVGVRNEMADGLDLRHRLPRLFGATLELRLPPWVARKVAAMSRRLGLHAVEVVDVAVSAAADESPARILAIAEAKVIEADIEAHRRRIRENEARKGVWFHRRRPGSSIDELLGEADVQGSTMRLSTAGAERFREMVDCLADALEDHSTPGDGDAGDEEPMSRDQLRAAAAELLADPFAAVEFLNGLAEGGRPVVAGESAQPEEPEEHQPPAASKRPHRRPAVLNVHVSAEVLCGLAPGVARVEGLGPMLLEQVVDLLRDRDVALQPVLDLNHVEAVNHYEHPTRVRRRTRLRNHGDVFPHSTTGGTSRIDMDHPSPYDRDGPPGQTGDRNAAPLARYPHRLKTHGGFALTQLGLGAYRWVTPHGLARVVTPRGTQRVEVVRQGGRVIGETYEARHDLAICLQG